MKNIKVISRKNLPTKLPLTLTLTIYLALDHWSAPEWLYGALSLYLIVVWIYIVIRVFKEEQVDVLDNQNNE